MEGWTTAWGIGENGEKLGEKDTRRKTGKEMGVKTKLRGIEGNREKQIEKITKREGN